MGQYAIDWSKIKDQKSLVDSLKVFLEKIFGTDLINKELNILRSVPKGRSEDLRYTIEPNIHRVAKWYKLLKAMKERGYSFDLRFSSEVEEFIKLLIFVYSFNEILRNRVLDIQNKSVSGALRDRDRFESLMYEITVAANYISNGFYVEFPELGGERIDIYAKKDATEAYAECKALRGESKYAELAVNVVEKLQDRELCAFVDITLTRTPRISKDVHDLMVLVNKAIDTGMVNAPRAKIEVRELPECMRGPFEINVLDPKYIEYVLASSYVRFSLDGFEVKNLELSL